MPRRYAIYFAPAPGSALWHFGRSWLGRCADMGEAIAHLRVPSIAPDVLHALTETPRLYGWHATLKAPFALRQGAEVSDLLATARALGASHPALDAPALSLARMGDFLALVPSSTAPALNVLAAALVEGLDRFRAPPHAEELERRQKAGLTARQEVFLARWGYPYVMDEFRFHMTLTGALKPAELDAVEAALTPLIAPLCERALRIDHLAIFFQDAPGAPFRVLERIPLSAASARSRATNPAIDSASGASLRKSITSPPSRG